MSNPILQIFLNRNFLHVKGPNKSEHSGQWYVSIRDASYSSIPTHLRITKGKNFIAIQEYLFAVRDSLIYIYIFLSFTMFKERNIDIKKSLCRIFRFSNLQVA